MGGLGDLAVVDLLEGVEALAGGRHGVHEMHGGGSLFGGIWGLKVGGMRSSGLVLSSVACAGLAFSRIHMKLERKSRAQFGSAKISKVDASGCTILTALLLLNADQGTSMY